MGDSAVVPFKVIEGWDSKRLGPPSYRFRHARVMKIDEKSVSAGSTAGKITNPLSLVGITYSRNPDLLRNVVIAASASEGFQPIH